MALRPPKVMKMKTPDAGARFGLFCRVRSPGVAFSLILPCVFNRAECRKSVGRLALPTWRRGAKLAFERVLLHQPGMRAGSLAGR
jgi:hypothetical protein